MTRPQKITLAEMRAAGVRGLLVYCSVRSSNIHDWHGQRGVRPTKITEAEISCSAVQGP
jgi:hypothetical protein